MVYGRIFNVQLVRNPSVIRGTLYLPTFLAVTPYLWLRTQDQNYLYQRSHFHSAINKSGLFRAQIHQHVQRLHHIRFRQHRNRARPTTHPIRRRENAHPPHQQRRPTRSVSPPIGQNHPSSKAPSKTPAGSNPNSPARAIDTVFLNLTGTDDLFTTMNFLSCVQRCATVKHLVYLSACGDFLAPGFATRRSSGRASRPTWSSRSSPSRRSRRRGRGPRPAASAGPIIGPTLFMENDKWAKGAMMASGFFPKPIGTAGVSRVACRDVALAVVKAVEDQGRVWDRKKIMIGTKETYTVRESFPLPC